MGSAAIDRRTLLRGVAAAGLLAVAFPARSHLASAAGPPVDPGPGRQLVLVSADPSDPTTATLSTWRWAGSEWRRTLPALDSRLGANGITSNPTEADGCTPSGTYSIQYAFGQSPSIGGTLPYRQTTTVDHWVDDPQSAFYNTWQTGTGDGRWNSAEVLAEYELAVVFDFNQHPVVANGNSAIFLHAGASDETSAGCVTVGSFDELAWVVRWLDPTEQPTIIIGTGSHLPADPAELNRMLTSA